MLGATHHEAVSTLRNAGSCIKMKVLRERMMLPTDEPQDPGDMIDGVDLPQLCGVQRSKQSRVDAAPDCLPRKIEAVLCNGSSTVSCLLQSQHYLLVKFHHCSKGTLSHLFAEQKCKLTRIR